MAQSDEALKSLQELVDRKNEEKPIKRKIKIKKSNEIEEIKKSIDVLEDYVNHTFNQSNITKKSIDCAELKSRIENLERYTENLNTNIVKNYENINKRLNDHTNVISTIKNEKTNIVNPEDREFFEAENKIKRFIGYLFKIVIVVVMFFALIFIAYGGLTRLFKLVLSE